MADTTDAATAEVPWYRPLFDADLLPMLICDRESRHLIAANDYARRQYGAELAAFPRLPFARLAPPQAPELRRWHCRHADGTESELPLLRYPIEHGGSAALLLLLPPDVDAPEQSRQRLREELRRVEEIAHVGSWEWLPDQDRHHFSSPESLRILGIASSELPLTGARLLRHVEPADRETLRAARARLCQDPQAGCDIEFRIRHPTDGIRYVHAFGRSGIEGIPPAVKLRGVLQDVSCRRFAEDDIMRLAYYDEMTGLPNRLLYRKRLAEALATPAIAGRGIALVFVDLVRFRDINYTFGHLNGNDLLRAAARRITRLLGRRDVVARVGARFIMMLPDTDSARATRRARQLLASLEEPFPLAGVTYELNARLGIAIMPEHGTDSETLLRKADIALYQADHNGQSFAFYDAANDPYKPRRLALTGELRKAIQDGELRLYCQPKADMRTGEIVGAESLVRWQHHDFGLIQPDQFIPLIESTDLIHVLTRFMLESSLQQSRTWHEQGIHMPLAVNLSTRNLLESDLTDRLGELLQKWDAQADWLGLEITESSLMHNPDNCIAMLNRLSRTGFRLFVDDFGTGFSSLSYLTRLPINVIKIDHGFTMQMTRDKAAATIVKSTIDLAHDLGMTVVAEGTASREIWDALNRLGCDEAQGYLISPPLAADEFVDWWKNSPYRPPAPKPPMPAAPLPAG